MERLALIEVLDHDGHVAATVPVTRWPVTIGRALDCDVVLHDPHVAAHHATLEYVDGSHANESSGAVAGSGRGALSITVGDSVNGVRWAQRQLSAGATAPLPAGAVWHAGRSALRVRMAGEALAPEQPLAHPARQRHTVLSAIGVVVLLLWLTAQLWLQNEPGSRWDKYLPLLLVTVLAIAAWCALWGLGSKLFGRRFRFMPHLQILLGFALASLLLDLLLALGSYALSWPWLSHVRNWAELAVAAALLATHTALLLPRYRRPIALVFSLLFLLTIGINGALNWRRSDRLFAELYAATLPPPALRLVDAQPPSELLDAVRAMRTALDRRAQDDEDRESLAEPE
jgi:hypothetical protein